MLIVAKMAHKVAEIILFYLAFHAASTLKAPGNLRIPVNRNCALESIPETNGPYFSYNGSDIPSNVTSFNVLSNETHCQIDLDSVLAPIIANGSLSFYMIKINCVGQLYIQLQSSKGMRYSDVISLLRFSGCGISSDSINILGRLFDLQIIIANDATIYVQNNDSVSHCWLENIGSLILTNVKIIPNIAMLFQCGDTYPKLAEISLRAMNLTKLPNVIEQKCIHLQSLDLKDNFISKVPAFPWSNVSVTLPRNLSRSRFLQEQYTDAFDIEVESNLFRRIIILDNNKLSRLYDGIFIGDLQLISIDYNTVESIAPGTFSNVSSVQTLRMQHNTLSTTLNFTFSELTDLRQLYLGHNQFLEINRHTFSHLLKLQKLNLEYNRIAIIDKTAFIDLLSLQSINIANNLIVHISSDLFTKNTKLVEINLNNNPILYLPQSLLAFRNIKSIGLRHTSVTLDNVDSILNRLDPELLKFSQAGGKDFLFAPPDKRTNLDLSNSRVESLRISFIGERKVLTVSLFLRNFDIRLSGNPLKCDCQLLTLHEYLSNYVDPTDNTANPMEYYLHSWQCMYPAELNGRTFGSIKPDEMYSIDKNVACPSACSCYRRCISRRLIIDCRNRNLIELPLSAIHEDTEWWLQNNNITSLENRNYFLYASKINLRNNSLMMIDNTLYEHFGNTPLELNLENNLLKYLPKTFRRINFDKLYLNGNNFICDCHSVWMKAWIFETGRHLPDGNTLTCTTHENSGFILDIPDKMFVCPSSPSSHVVEVIIVSVTISFFVIIVMLLGNVFRRELAFRLFVHFNFRLFKTDSARGLERYVLLVYPSVLESWIKHVMSPILRELMADDLIKDVRADLVAGLSYKDNVDMFVVGSKRMIFVMSPQTRDDELCNYALSAACDKSRNGRPEYFLPLLHEVEIIDIQDKFIKKFIKVKRFMRSDDKRLKNRIDYYLCPVEPDETKWIEAIEHSSYQNDIFLSSSYSDVKFSLDLLKKLEQKSYKLCFPERDYKAAVTIHTNIIDAVKTSNFKVICLSNAHIEDEWTVFTFQVAQEECLKNKNSKLILILHKDLDIESLDENMRHYIETHVCLYFDDERLVEKLARSFKCIEELSARRIQEECNAGDITITLNEDEEATTTTQKHSDVLSPNDTPMSVSESA